MGRAFTIALIIVCALNSCGQKSQVFENCNCEQVDLRNGIKYADSLYHYRITYPDSSWLPTISQNGNGITVGDTSKGYLRLFAVTVLEKTFSFDQWEEQQRKIEAEFNVIDKGLIKYQNQEVHWNLVKFENNEPVIWTLYLTVDHPTNKLFYTLNLTVEDGANIKKRICTLESFLDEFKIISAKSDSY